MDAKQLERTILLNKILEERTFSEIAAELGMNPKTVSSIYYRLIEKIKKVVGETNEF